MGFLKGVNLLPSTGEFTYDTVPYLGHRHDETTLKPLNLYVSNSVGSVTDYTLALDALQTQMPDCETVSLVVAWFGNSTDAASCQIYPSTSFIGGVFQQASGKADVWRCSGLTQNSSGLIPPPSSGGAFVYGGTPSDQSIVRCLQDLKNRGLRTVFYPFILMTSVGYPWRGRITYTGADVTDAAASAVNAFLGTATPAHFTRDATNLSVAYAGSPHDYTYRRMILHYTNLCVLAGGVDIFLLGSEFRGLEAVRGPTWTKAGMVDSSGKASWDYPFVAGLMQLADDVRSVFDSAGLTKDLSDLHNLIAYSADWSNWMGTQHPGENGQWPHLDQLFAHPNIDVVSFDNYLPIADWTTGGGGLDVANWNTPAPNPAAWPPSAAAMNGLGLSGTPSLYSKTYLKANIEGGEKFNWYYNDGTNAGIGLDPAGSGLRVSLPQGDRLAQNRSAYFPNQELLANKQLRWWWNNPHRAIYDNGDGNGWAPHGPTTQWVPQSKSITFAEYGVPACDRGTNQPNVAYDPKSTESFTPYWSIWDPAEGARFQPRRDDEIQLLGLRAIYEYWVEDGNNATSASGVSMIEPAFMSAWNWDARPFPAFPMRSDVWGDTGNWRTGDWLSGKGPYLIAQLPDAPPTPPTYPLFPDLNGQGWSIHHRPTFATQVAEHVSGRQSCAAETAAPSWEIELAFDLLRMNAGSSDLQNIIAFYDQMQGQDRAFLFPVDSVLGLGTTLVCRFDEDQIDLEEFARRLWTLQSLKLRSVKF